MKLFQFKLRYTNVQKSTNFELEGKFVKFDKQDDQSSKDVLGLVLDYLPLVIKWYSVVSFLSDTFSTMI